MILRILSLVCKAVFHALCTALQSSCCIVQDYSVMSEVIERVKERLRGVPKLDVLSMPFRVSFVKVGTYR